MVRDPAMMLHVPTGMWLQSIAPIHYRGARRAKLAWIGWSFCARRGIRDPAHTAYAPARDCEGSAVVKGRVN